jgi:hypothetical protein
MAVKLIHSIPVTRLLALAGGRQSLDVSRLASTVALFREELAQQLVRL